MYSLTGLVILLIVGLWTYYEFREKQLAAIQANVHNQLELFDFALTNFLVEAENDVQALSENEMIQSSAENDFTSFLNADESTFEYHISGDEQKIIDILNAYRTSRTYVNSVYIGYENGSFVRSHPRSAPTQYDPRLRPWYTLAEENLGKIMTTEPYQSVTTPDVNIGIVKALIDQENNIFGVIGADITLVDLTEYISGFEIGYAGQLFIIDQNGNILASRDQENLFKHIDTILAQDSSALLTNEEGNFTSNASYYYFQTCRKSGWKIAAAIPIELINREVQRSALNPPLLSLVITIVLFGLLSILGLDAFISKPLIELNKVTQHNSRSENEYQQVNIHTNDEIGELGSAYNQMIEVRKQTEIALKQERDLAKALAEAIAVLVKTLDFELVLDFILEQVSLVVPNDSANIMLIDGDWARISRSRGYEKFGLQDAMRKAGFNITEVASLQQMFVKREPLIIRDTAKYARWKKLEGQEFLRSYAGAPIIVRDKVIGFLNVDSALPNFFTSVHIETLKTFADYAAIAIDNAQMHEQIRRHAADLNEQVKIATQEIHRKASELESLYRIGKEITSTLDLKAMLQIITDEAARIADADRCILFLVDHDRKTLAYVGGSGISSEEFDDYSYEEFMQSLNGWVFIEKIPALSKNILKDKRQTGAAQAHSREMQECSMAVAPLEIADSMIGTLAVINRKGKKVFIKGDLNLIVMLADQASITIQNVRLFERAQEADRLKSAFLASMSHELRTPLNSIIGFTGILLQGLVGALNEEQNKQLRMVQNSANHLLDLINDILDLSKIEAGQLVVNCAPFNLRSSIEMVVQTLMPLVDKKGLSLKTVIHPDVGVINSDQRRVEQILLNLANNAIKFTNEGQVDIECTIKKNRVEINVIDTGIGINENDLEKLFNPFQQIDTGLTRQYEGTGLGLSICKRLVEKLNGKIWVASEWGKGSVFSFALPVSKREKNK